jgi:hypothetical protein
MTQEDSAVYARLLLAKKQGFPLWLPQPHDNLPNEYRKKGVSIGDVGIVTSDGAFDFLFNICLPHDNPINGNRVPDNFQPLEPPDQVDILQLLAYNPGDHVASGSIKRLQPGLGSSIQPS